MFRTSQELSNIIAESAENPRKVTKRLHRNIAIYFNYSRINAPSEFTGVVQMINNSRHHNLLYI